MIRIRESIKNYENSNTIWSREYEVSDNILGLDKTELGKWYPPTPRISDPEGVLWFMWERVE